MGPHMRQQNWEILLDTYITVNKNVFFDYGESDCVRFCARWIMNATGKKVLKGILYRGVKSGERILKDGGGLWNLTTKQMQEIGNKEIPVTLAKRGDIIGIMTLAHGESVGICTGRNIVSPGDDGLVFLPMSEAHRAWEVA